LWWWEDQRGQTKKPTSGYANSIYNIKDSKSTSGYVFTLDGVIVLWKSSN